MASLGHQETQVRCSSDFTLWTPFWIRLGAPRSSNSGSKFKLDSSILTILVIVDQESCSCRARQQRSLSRDCPHRTNNSRCCFCFFFFWLCIGESGYTMIEPPRLPLLSQTLGLSQMVLVPSLSLLHAYSVTFSAMTHGSRFI